jgi:hypothetical protein
MKYREREDGQVIILVALALVGLLGIAGLAIDGGRLFTLRRKVQNAADAAAMAAARTLSQKIVTCSDGSVADDNEVAIAMVELARLNGFAYDAPNVTIAGWYTDYTGARIQPGRMTGYGFQIPTGATGFHVSLTVTETTTLMRVVGQTTISAHAETTVMIGPIKTVQDPPGTPILPLALSDQVLSRVSAGDEITLFDEETYCRGEPCDEDPPEALHGWLNLSFIYNARHNGGPLDRTYVTNVGASGCKFDGESIDVAATGLKGWAGEDKDGDGGPDCPYPNPVVAGPYGSPEGDWIHGEPGIRASALQAIRDGHGVGAEVVIPIFDVAYDRGDMADTFEAPAGTGGKWPSGGGGANNRFFHVVGFATAELLEIQDKPDNTEPADDDQPGNHSITATLVRIDRARPSDVIPTSGLGIRQVCAADKGLLLGLALWE